MKKTVNYHLYWDTLMIYGVKSDTLMIGYSETLPQADNHTFYKYFDRSSWYHGLFKRKIAHTFKLFVSWEVLDCW